MDDQSKPLPLPSFPVRLAHAAGRMLLACADLYALGLIGYYAIRLLTGFSLWPVALFSNFLHLASLPSLLILPIMLILRRWRRAVLSGLPVLAFLWLFGGLFIPNVGAPPDCGAPDCVKLTVMSLNLGDGGLVNEVSAESLVQTVLASNADVVGFQEVAVAQAEAMQNELSDKYPYRLVYAAGETVNGIALISRYPILEGEPFYGNPPTMPNLDVTLAIQGRPLHVLVVHPPPPGWSSDWLSLYRPRALGDARLYVQMVDAGPALLLGDMNATDQSETYAIFAQAGLADAYHVAGFGFGPTYPARQGYGYPFSKAIPLIRLDYVLYTTQLRVLSAWVGSDAGSDHLPIVAELAWRVESQ
jgi:vancomycin resistance protein VanJ